MISCKSQEDLLSYQFRSNSGEGFDYFKDIVERGVKGKNPRVMLGGSGKSTVDAFKQSHHMH